MNKTQVQNIVANPLASDEQRKKAQSILDQMTALEELEKTPEVVAAKGDSETGEAPSKDTNVTLEQVRADVYAGKGFPWSYMDEMQIVYAKLLVRARERARQKYSDPALTDDDIETVACAVASQWVYHPGASGASPIDE
jgi:hypothetical protein